MWISMQSPWYCCWDNILLVSVHCVACNDLDVLVQLIMVLCCILTRNNACIAYDTTTGKTTFIKYILERDFPGAHIGPEPTTDRFVAVMYGKEERIIPGNALAAAADKPFQALSKYGMAFL